MATPRTPVNSNFRTALPGNATQNRGSSSWGLKNDNVEMKKNRDWRAGCFADDGHDVLAQQYPWKEIFEPIYQSLQYTYTGRKCTWLDKLALNDGLRKASHKDEDLTQAGKAICQRRSRAHS
jgi:hypothetical protein